MTPSDLTGKRGEFIASGRLLDFCGNPRPYFAASARREIPDL
jgi:hypothetical protein